jgi:molybdenum cofactor biosynthesis enzyme MoaA
MCEAIKLIRAKTQKGIINLNTNASKPKAVEAMCLAGLQSMRVSMNSVQEQNYLKYYKPVNYTFADVLESIKIARSNGIWVSVNYFVFPGYTDEEAEVDALRRFIVRYDISMIQWRNFNIDPEWYASVVKPAEQPYYHGVKNLVDSIREAFPNIYHGYFNPGEEIVFRDRK